MANRETSTRVLTERSDSDKPVVLHFKPLALACAALFVATAQTGWTADGAAVQEQSGYKMGEFRIDPAVSVTERWDDNIFGLNDGEKDDTITNVSASVKANSEWQRHRINLDAGASADYYADFDSEDVVDWWLGGDGRFDLSAKSHLLGGLRFSQNHEDRASPDAATGSADPTTYVTSHAHVGLAHRLAPFTIRLGGVFENLNFKDGSSPTFDVDWRDRDQYSVGVRFSYQLQNAPEIFFQAATDTRTYDDQAVGRDSDGYRMGLGLRTENGPGFQAEAFIGYLSQDYDNIALKDVEGLYYGANLKWKPRASTQVTAYVDRSVNETTVSGASSHLDTTVGTRLEHDLSAKLALNASLTYNNSDYQGTDLELDEVAAGVGARYYFNKLYYVAGGYRHISRDANDPIYEYDKNLFFVTIGYAPRGR